MSNTDTTRTRRRATRPAGPVNGPGIEPEAPPTPEQPVVTAWWQRRSIRMGTVLVGISALVAVVIFGWLDHTAGRREEARQRSIAVARQTVLNLTTIHPDTAQRDVDRVLAGASGDFKAEFDGKLAPFLDVVQKAKILTNGQIVEAGLESESGDTTTILVAARTMVTNIGTERPEPRDFRFRVTVTDDNGNRTVSRLEFVP